MKEVKLGGKEIAEGLKKIKLQYSEDHLHVGCESCCSSRYKILVIEGKKEFSVPLGEGFPAALFIEGLTICEHTISLIGALGVEIEYVGGRFGNK